MTRILSIAFILALIALALYGAVTLYDESMQIGRMWETPAVRPHEKPLPVMAAGIVPVKNGEEFLRTADPQSLQAPFGLDEPERIARGGQGYRSYCQPCHGINHDGYGTVGQSFAPPPGDLRSARVQGMAGGLLFHEISYGIPNGRQPPLDTTIAVDERWQIIAYIKSLGVRP